MFSEPESFVELEMQLERIRELRFYFYRYFVSEVQVKVVDYISLPLPFVSCSLVNLPLGDYYEICNET